MVCAVFATSCSLSTNDSQGEPPCLYMSQIKDSKTLDNWHVYIRTNHEEHLLAITEEPCPLLKSEVSTGGLDRRQFGRVCADSFPGIIDFLRRKEACPVSSVVRVASEEDAENVARSRRLDYTRDFATRYAAAWSSRQPTEVAGFFTENGSFYINGRKRFSGRRRISAAVETVMTEFPDLNVQLLEIVELDYNDYEFHWRLTGTSVVNGNPIDIRGSEAWTLDGHRLIARSVRQFNTDQYEQQVAPEDD